ncbi:SusC/RagA family TonB-linked outer membrane protein [Pontibacter sp. MBLB2868]|uniref:SusC/RagA family TonB-linked outer membrane protein n=1 Tax=Pontibacter sp. MBLB2868 TaxID=3451555 RepID=UPI003F7516AB
MKKSLLFSLFLVLAVAVQAWAQQGRTVKGRVTSAADGTSLPGVTVLLEGTSIGANTDAQGQYSLTFPAAAGNTLVFSYLGFATKKENIGTKTEIDVQLQQATREISEVIVVGYVEQDVKKITGSVATVNSQVIEQVPIATFDQILQGRAPGLQVSASSGQPGATARVRIRGNGSINSSNDPLYIMDGVPIDANVFASINPNDIESVNILKDAASTSVYGSRAANGVIVITTKRGKAGKTKINYSGQYGVSVPTRVKFDMMNTAEKIQFESYLATKGIYKGAVGSLYQQLAQGTISQAQLDNRVSEIAAINTDWSDVFFREGKTQTHEVNANGGDEKTRFYISGSYFDQSGIALRSDLERYSGRVNIDHDTKGKFRFGVNAYAGYSTSNFIESEGAVALANPFASAYLNNPYERVRDPETGEFLLGATGMNVVERNETTTNDRNELKVISNVYGEFDIMDGLTLKNLTGIDYRTREFERLVQPFTRAGNSSTGKQGSLNQASNYRTKLISTTTLNYNKAIGDLHFLDILVGGEVNKEIFKSTTYTGYGLNAKIWSPAGISPGTPDNGFIPVVGGTNSESALVSAFFNGNYTYNGKYNLSAGLRRDGSSRFGENNRYATFYSVGAAWNISEENFMKNYSWIDNLKLRASYGTAGNQEGIGDFQALGTYSIVSYDGAQGIAPTTTRPNNPDLKWEVLTSANVGLDFSFFDRRISGSLDVYNNVTSDLFIDTQLSRTSGFATLTRNAGEMRNRGIEVGLNGDVIRTSDFVWSLGVNYAYNDNEILDLFQVEEFEQGTSIIRKGLPLGTHYIPTYLGVNPANGDALYLGEDGGVVNDYALAAYNTHGTFNPPHTGGFNTSLTYKNFDLSAFFSFVQGNQLFNNNTFFLTNPAFGQYNQQTIMLTAWDKPGDITEIPRVDVPRNFSTFDLEDGSYLRFRNVILAYKLPVSLIEKAKLNRARVFVQAQNLFTITKFTGFDPEIANNILQFNYPVPRTYTVGIDISL